jgi:hypothetical protein
VRVSDWLANWPGGAGSMLVQRQQPGCVGTHCFQGIVWWTVPLVWLGRLIFLLYHLEGFCCAPRTPWEFLCAPHMCVHTCAQWSECLGHSLGITPPAWFAGMCGSARKSNPVRTHTQHTTVCLFTYGQRRRLWVCVFVYGGARARFMRSWQADPAAMVWAACAAPVFSSAESVPTSTLLVSAGF